MTSPSPPGPSLPAAEQPSWPAWLPDLAGDAAPRWLPDLAAGTATAVALVLLGAPLGLLWAAVAPRVPVDLTSGRPAFDVETPAFIAADATFLGLALAAGVVTGAVAWVLARRHGLGVVLGLLLGGLLAAYVAARTGQQVGRATFTAAVEAAARGEAVTSPVRAAVRLRMVETVVFWPAGALATFALLTWRRTAEPREESLSAQPAVSTG